MFRIDQEKQSRAVHFVSNLGFIITPYCKQYLGRNSVAVLRTNHQIYFEARGVLYGSRQFSIGINQMSCIGNNSKPFTPVSSQAVPATWSVRFREHLYLMTKLKIYIHLDKPVLRESDADPPAKPDNTISEAIRAAILGADLVRNQISTNISLHQILQTHNGNAAILQLPNAPAAAAANFNAHVNHTANLAANPAFHLPVNPAANIVANGVANVHGAAINAANGPNLAVLRALEYQNMDNVMVIKAALEELCHVLSMCAKLKDVDVIYIDTSGDSSPGGLGLNILHPFKNLARSIRCRVTYVPLRGRFGQPLPADLDTSKMEGAVFKQDTTFSDTLCHLKAISSVSNVVLTPGCIAELNRQLDSL